MPIKNNPNNKFSSVKAAIKEEHPAKPVNNSTPNITEIDGLCKMLNIGKNTAYNLLTSGEIDSFKVGSVWKIPVSSINDYIERKCKESKLVLMYSIINRNRDMYFERHHDLPLRYWNYKYDCIL